MPPMPACVPQSLVAAGPRQTSNVLGPPPPASLCDGETHCPPFRGDDGLQMLLGAVALYDSPVTAADVPPVSHDEDSHAMLSLLEFNRLAAAAASEAHKLPFLDMPGNTYYMNVSHEQLQVPQELELEALVAAASAPCASACFGSRASCNTLALPALHSGADSGHPGSTLTGNEAAGWAQEGVRHQQTLPAASTASVASDANTAMQLLLLGTAVSSRQAVGKPPTSTQQACRSQQCADSCDRATPAGDGGHSAAVSGASRSLGCSSASQCVFPPFANERHASQLPSCSAAPTHPGHQLQQHSQYWPQHTVAAGFAGQQQQPAASGGSRDSGAGRPVISSGAGLGAIGGVQKQQAKKARSPQKELQRAAAARQRKIWESEVTADLLEEKGCFDMTQAEAARQLGFMSPTTLKKAMGRLGIKQWPNRKRSTVKNLIAGLEDYLPQYGDPARVAAVLEAVRSELAPFLHTLTGSIEMPPDILALRQVVYKLKNEVKHGEKEGKLQQEVERLLVTLLERSARRQAAASLPQEATHA